MLELLFLAGLLFVGVAPGGSVPPVAAPSTEPPSASAPQAPGAPLPRSLPRSEGKDRNQAAETADIVDALRRAVLPCWVVRPGTAAAQTPVTVRFQLNGDGHIAMDRVELVTNGGPVGEAEKQAFEAARNAVLRCEGEGYDIPGLSRPMDIELAFDPTAPAEPRQ